MFCSTPSHYDKKKNPKLDNVTVLWHTLKKGLFYSRCDDTEILCEVHLPPKLPTHPPPRTMNSPDLQTRPQNRACCQRLCQVPREQEVKGHIMSSALLCT